METGLKYTQQLTYKPASFAVGRAARLSEVARLRKWAAWAVATGIVSYRLDRGEQEFRRGDAMNVLTRFSIVVILGLSACSLLAQSLGDVARENRNASRPHAKKVVTNDDMPSVDTMSPAAGQAKDSAAGSDEKKAGGEKDAKAGAPEPAASVLAKKDADQKKLETELNQKYAKQQEKVSLLERELKVSEQEYRQKELAHMADVNARLNGQAQYAEAEKLEQTELDQKKEKLSAERQKLADMQEDARHAGVKLPE